MPEGRRAERRPTLERQGDAERGERRLERDANRVQRRADHRDLVRGDPGTDRAQRLLGHELERPAGSRSFEEADGTVERRALRRRCEQLALDVRQRRRQVLGGARRQVDDVVSGERRQIHGRARERGVDGAARLVRQRDMDVGARRERLEEAPLGAGEVLEAVREHRAVAPRPEVAGQPLDAPATEHPPIPCIEPVELVAVGADERCERLVEVVGVEERAVELRQRPSEGVGIPGEPCARRIRAGIDDPPNDHRALRFAHQPPAEPVATRERLEERVERADRAREQPSLAPNELALDPLDVAAVRDDQPGIAVDRGDETVEKRRDLSGMRRTDDERETHRCMVVGPVSRPRLRAGRETRSERETDAGAPAIRIAPRRATSACGRAARPPRRAFHRHTSRRDPPALRLSARH